MSDDPVGLDASQTTDGSAEPTLELLDEAVLAALNAEFGAELLPELLAALEADIADAFAALTEAASARNAAAAINPCHAIKGVAATAGLASLRARMAEMEAEAKGGVAPSDSEVGAVEILWGESRSAWAARIATLG